MKVFLILLLSAAFVSAEDVQKSYEGYRLYKLEPRYEVQNQFLLKLEGNRKLDFWQEATPSRSPVSVLVAPEDQEALENVLDHQDIKYSITIDNLQKLIIEEKIKDAIKTTEDFGWESYHSLENIHAWFDQLQEQYPNIVTTQTAGRSYENRDLKGVKVSFGPGKKAVFIEGGTHAREWISPATATYILNELLHTEDSTFKKIAESFDWYIFPNINPDGYVFTKTNERLWRKTRSDHHPGDCRGVDSNRNWNATWGQEGTGKKPCSDTYGGPSPFSEKETAQMATFIDSVAKSLVAYISFHSYGQVILLPYGHTTAHLDNYDDMLRIGKKAIEGLSERYGTKYGVGNVPEMMYKHSGGSIDWVKKTHKVPIVMLYELRDMGKYGFLIPEEQIIPNGLEIVDSLKALFKEAESIGYVELNKT